jgi:hypothetical protein
MSGILCRVTPGVVPPIKATWSAVRRTTSQPSAPASLSRSISSVRQGRSLRSTFLYSHSCIGRLPMSGCRGITSRSDGHRSSQLIWKYWLRQGIIYAGRRNTVRTIPHADQRDTLGLPASTAPLACLPFGVGIPYPPAIMARDTLLVSTSLGPRHAGGSRDMSCRLHPGRRLQDRDTRVEGFGLGCCATGSSVYIIGPGRCGQLIGGV